MRLAAEHELQLDRTDAVRREDKARAEERMQQLARWGVCACVWLQG